MTGRAKTVFFTAGGTLGKTSLSYVVRSADEELYRAMHYREFAYVLTSRQMGKSSLMVRTAIKLRDEGATVVVLDLTAFGQNLTLFQWYYSLAEAVAQSTIGAHRFASLADESREQPPLQLFLRVIQASIPEQHPLLIFLDEIDAVLSLPFSTDELFAAIRQIYNRRSEVDTFQRLSFCLIGVASPSDLIRDTRTTPFNIGQRIELHDFTLAEALFLAPGLPGDPAEQVRMLNRIYSWTSGHPYLTQRCCKALAEREDATGVPDVEHTCRSLFHSPRSTIQDDNLTFVRARLLNGSHDRMRLLQLYRRILRGRTVRSNESDPLQSILRLSGAVKVAVAGTLRVRNRIYSRAFDTKWINANLPNSEWRRRRQAFAQGFVLASVAAILVITIIGYLANTVRRQRDESRLQLYLATLNLAREAMQNRDTYKAGALLERVIPASHSRDFRGFEWYGLWNRVHADRPIVSYESIKGIPDTATVWGGYASLLGLTDKHEVVALSAQRANAVPVGLSLGSTEYLACATSNGHILTVDSKDGIVKAGILKDKSAGVGSRLAITILGSLYSVLACSSDGEVAAIYDHSEVSLYSIANGTKLFHHPVSDRVLRLAFSSDHSLLAIGSRNTVQVWRTDFLRLITTAPVDQPGSLIFCPHNECIAWPDYNGVHLWSLRSLRESALFPSRGLDGSVDISPDGQLIACSRFDGVSVWDIATGKSTRTFQPYRMPSVVRFLPDSKHILAMSIDRGVSIWDIYDSAGMAKSDDEVYTVGFSPESDRLAYGGNNGLVVIWDVAARKPLFQIDVRERVEYLAYVHSSIVLINSTHHLFLMEFEKKKLEPLISSAGGRLVSALSPNRQFVAVTDIDAGSVRLISIRDQRVVRDFPVIGHPLAVAVSPDNRNIAVSLMSNDILVFGDHSTRRLPGSWASRAMLFSNTGVELIAGYDNGSASRWDWMAERILKSSELHRGPIKAISVSPDASRLVTASDDGTVRFWIPQTFEPIVLFETSDKSIEATEFSANGQLLATAGDDGHISLWNAAKNPR